MKQRKRPERSGRKRWRKNNRAGEAEGERGGQRKGGEGTPRRGGGEPRRVSAQTEGETAGARLAPGGREAAAGRAESGSGGWTCPGRGEREPSGPGCGAGERGTGHLRHRRRHRSSVPTPRSPSPPPPGCPGDPGIQHGDRASPRMGRCPQLRLVKVRASQSALEHRGPPVPGAQGWLRGQWV